MTPELVTEKKTKMTIFIYPSCLYLYLHVIMICNYVCQAMPLDQSYTYIFLLLCVVVG